MKEDCVGRILEAVNARFGTKFTEANVQGKPFKNGGTVNIYLRGENLPAKQFNAIQPGRYPLDAITYLAGYGATLHLPTRNALDPDAIFWNRNLGDQTTVYFTAHLDIAYPYNPIGALIHLTQLFLPHDQCPEDKDDAAAG